MSGSLSSPLSSMSPSPAPGFLELSAPNLWLNAEFGERYLEMYRYAG